MKNLKLTSINAGLLSNLEMSQVKGGLQQDQSCSCACKYAKIGGSTTSQNGNANFKNGQTSPGMKPINLIGI